MSVKKMLEREAYYLVLEMIDDNDISTEDMLVLKYSINTALTRRDDRRKKLEYK